MNKGLIAKLGVIGFLGVGSLLYSHSKNKEKPLLELAIGVPVAIATAYGVKKILDQNKSEYQQPQNNNQNPPAVRPEDQNSIYVDARTINDNRQDNRQDNRRIYIIFPPRDN